MKKASYLVVVVALSVISSVCLSQTLARSGNPCSSCHSQFYQDLDILEGDSGNQIPTTVNVGETKNVTVAVQNLCNAFLHTSMSNVSVTLKSQNGHFAVEIPTYNVSTFPVGKEIVTWQISGVSAGADALLITAQGANTHQRLSFSDSYYPPPPITIGQSAAAIRLSKAQLFFTIGESNSGTFEVIAESEARNITITPSPNLSSVIDITSPHSIASIEPGQNVTVSLSFNGNQPVVDNGTIDIAWVDKNGRPDSTSVSVTISEPSSANLADTSLLRWTGRITGFVNLGLVSLSIGLSKVKMKKNRKVRLHCAVSWSLLVLSVCHGAVLLIGPYSDAILTQNVIIGYGSALTMGIASVIGLLQKQIAKATNHATWLWMHRLFLIVGAMLGVLHGILIGTDFALIRNLRAHLMGA
jgi:hypothetical protein